MNIEELLISGESQTIEFKESFGRESIETVVAFANTKGGIVLIGVDDNGNIKGTSVGKETIADWSNQIAQATEPTVIPELQLEKVNEKQLVLFRVKEYPLKPVSFKGRCFKRVGNANKQMSPQEIAQMHLLSTGNSWDALPVNDLKVDFLELRRIEEYLEIAESLGRKKFLNKNKPAEILKKMGLVKNEKLTWATVLLFGKNPQIPLTQATIHCGRFKGETIIIDDRLIAGNIIDQIDETLNFIRKNINVEFLISGKAQRDEIWDYPLEALREAVVNAICHRDYSNLADIQIKIYDNSIQIWNPGGLPFDLTIQDLLDPSHSSRPRNKLIAQVFYDMGIIERYGSGIQRIIDACTKAGLSMPIFEEKFGGFMITFRKDIFTESYLKELGLNERQIKAVMYVKSTGKITNNEYQKLNKVSKRTATRDFQVLLKMGIIIQSGVTGKGTEYTLKGALKGSKGS